MNVNNQHSQIAPDIIEAIGNPPTPRSWPTEAESGYQMKMLALEMIAKDEIRSKDDAAERYKARIAAISALNGVLDDRTQQVWARMETQFFRSCCKYFNDLNQSKETIR